jgi:hypothetical protein
MGIRFGHLSVGALMTGAVLVSLVIPALAATRAEDVQIAKAGTLVAADLPATFTSTPAPSSSSSADKIELAKGIPGCAPYIALQKVTAAQPQAISPDFDDEASTVSNEVDVFKKDRAAADALALFAKPSMVGCLQKFYKKVVSQAATPDTGVTSLSVTLDRRDIAGLGDDSVVYEGNVTLVAPDGSQELIVMGIAAIQVGRAVDVVMYQTSSPDVAAIVTPAIDASVARLRTALAAS